MTLRTRLAVAVAVLVAGAIALSGVLTVVTARRELTSEVDDFLRVRVESLRAVEDLAESREGRPFRPPGRVFFDQADAVTQLLGPGGGVALAGQIALPVDDIDVAIADHAAASRIRSVSVDGIDYRVITSPIGRVGAIQIGRDLSEVDNALEGLTRRTIVLGVIGAGLAAVVAWLLAARLSRPVARLTSAAEHVAATQDLAATIDVEGSDEVARLAGSFNTMLQALDTSRRQQHRLVMDASHELRTPLTGIRTNIELLQRARSLPAEERDEVLAAVGSEVVELTALVSELVDLATESSRPEEPIHQVDVSTVVSDVVERFRRRSGREIVIDSKDSVIAAMRVGAIDRAVSNLVDNAIKFSPDASPVEIAVAGRRVTVRDHGEGIAPADRPHIFDRFYRSTDTRTMPGSGLGLSIVAEIVRGHGGEVFVADPDEGPGIIVGFELGQPPSY
jgi:two-component system, OmpR family, sensor histidine kinase MprB